MLFILAPNQLPSIFFGVRQRARASSKQIINKTVEFSVDPTVTEPPTTAGHFPLAYTITLVSVTIQSTPSILFY